MPLTLYCHAPLEDAERAELQTWLEQNAARPDDTYSFARDLTPDQRRDACQAATVVYGNVPPEWLAGATNLRWLQLASAGFDRYQQVDWSRLPGVVVTNLHGFFGQACAETMLAGILAVYRGVAVLRDHQNRSEWVGGRVRSSLQLLHGKQALVLGAGAIGNTTGRLLEAFGCRVTYLRRSQPPTLADLDTYLPTTDLVVGTLPETPETMGLFTREKLSQMKPGSVLANVGRGSLIDEAALVETLTNGPLAGAVLDVTAAEPLPPDSPLWQHPNVVLTQHTGGGFAEEELGKLRFFLDNLRRFQADEPLLNQVNFERGY